MAELTNEEIAAKFEKLEAAHDELKAAHDQIAETVKTLQGVKPAGPKKEPAFKPEDAENLDKSDKPENEYHFTVLNKGKTVKYKFTHGHVTPPIVPGKPSVKITAKVAQADKELQAKLVEIGSGQIKEVF